MNPDVGPQAAPGRVSRVEQYREALRRLPRGEWAAYLDRHSGLPGPRANLALLQATGDEGNAAWFPQLAGSPDEFRAATGTAGLGRVLAERPDETVLRQLHELAADPRWRVREGVAMALQRLGDVRPEDCGRWSGDGRSTMTHSCKGLLSRECVSLGCCVLVLAPRWRSKCAA